MNKSGATGRHWLWRAVPAFLAVVGCGLLLAYLLSDRESLDSFVIQSPEEVLSGGDSNGMAAPDETSNNSGLNEQTTDQYLSMPQSRSRKVYFDELESVRVEFRSFDKRVPIFPLQIVDGYADFAEKARNGDAASAFSLYNALSQCQRAYTDEVDLETAIEKLHATRSLALPNRTEPMVFRGEDIQNTETQLRNDYSRCKGLTDTQKFEDYRAWLKMSADGEFLPAVDRLSWTQFEKGEFDDSLASLDKAWILGSPLATRGLYELYKHGHGNIEPDKVTAAAYLYLGTALAEAQRPPGSYEKGGVIERMLGRSAELLEQELLSLNQHEVQTAVSMAREILTSNPNCCVDW